MDIDTESQADSVGPLAQPDLHDDINDEGEDDTGVDDSEKCVNHDPDRLTIAPTLSGVILTDPGLHPDEGEEAICIAVYVKI